jgi:hypothetical protein
MSRTHGEIALFFAVVSLFLCPSCQKPKPEAEYSPTTPIKYLMEHIIDPAADTIWDSVGTKISRKGALENAPHTDEEWAALRLSAIQLQEASNLIQIPGRHVTKPGERNPEGLERQPHEIEALINGDRQTWISFAHGLRDGATLALKAVDAKDIAKLLDSGEQLDNACERCHQHYRYLRPARSPLK